MPNDPVREAGEPVAWLAECGNPDCPEPIGAHIKKHDEPGTDWECACDKSGDEMRWTPLYTHPASAGEPCNHPTAPAAIVAELFASTDEMECCGRVCLPGTFTRMWVANAIGKAIAAARPVPTEPPPSGVDRRDLELAAWRTKATELAMVYQQGGSNRRVQALIATLLTMAEGVPTEPEGGGEYLCDGSGKVGRGHIPPFDDQPDCPGCRNCRPHPTGGAGA